MENRGVLYFCNTGPDRLIKSIGYKHSPELGARVFGSHERFSDQECLNSRVPQLRDLSRAENPAFGHRDSRRRDMRQEIERGFEPRLESAQVAVVDADQRGGELEGEVELDSIVHF